MHTATAAAIVALTGSLAAAQASDPMASAAAAFLENLRPELRERASMPFDDANRLDWHYVPRDRRGVSLKDMTEGERVAAHELLRSALSTRGYLKATSIMELDQVLREAAEARGGRADHRDPLLYYVTVFGDARAGESAPWGWRIEGHHLSLNFSSVAGEVAVTPAFLGTNPAEVREGRRSGLRVLTSEEELARELLGSLDAEQRGAAVLETAVPGDILMSPGKGVEALGEESGLAAREMTERQRALVSLLIAEWAGNLEPDIADQELERIRGLGIERVRFLWIGATDPGRPHYYRLRGPTFVIEYQNSQDGANHVHTVWRDPERDFGASLLADHLREEHEAAPGG